MEIQVNQSGKPNYVFMQKDKGTLKTRTYIWICYCSMMESCGNIFDPSNGMENQINCCEKEYTD